MERIDKLLVSLNLAETRSQAALYIKEGVVYENGKQVKKPSHKSDGQNIEVRKDTIYVGRGAYKIEKAISKFNINVKNIVLADVGACTGGFTDYLLKNGAAKSFTIDVGHDQLSKKLLEDSRVINFEGVNIRDGIDLGEEVDLAVSDLSFISLKLVLKEIFNLVKDQGDIVTLVKPQFEVGKDGIDKNGIVKSKDLRDQAMIDFFKWCEAEGLFIRSFIDSPIKGKNGNIEFLAHFKKGDVKSMSVAELEKFLFDLGE